MGPAHFRPARRGSRRARDRTGPGHGVTRTEPPAKAGPTRTLMLELLGEVLEAAAAAGRLVRGRGEPLHRVAVELAPAGGFGTRPAMIRSSHARAPGPVTRYFPKFCTSLMPTPSRTARTSRPVASNASERRKDGVSYFGSSLLAK